MPVRVVESSQNSRVKELRKALSAPGRGKSGCVGIEGPNLVEEALRAGLRVRTVFGSQGAERLLDSLRIPPETEVLSLPLKLLASVLATETPQPVAALVEPPDWTWAHIPTAGRSGAALIVVLAGIQDPGNLGTILRSAEAFGADGVVSLPGTVSAWNSKAVRASAGSVFRVPVVAASERTCREKLREAGVRLLATTVRGAQPADLVDMAGPVALIIGNEGNGVPKEIARQADGTVTIPCPGPVESLNAAVAASVLLYEASRQRAAASGGPADHRGARR
ncbi:MAG: TrmH family RNA methyltransferase [Terracidiphilus sp.]